MVEEQRFRETDYNLDELKEMSDNNQEFINRMIYLFIKNSEESIAKFKHLLADKKWREIGETAHKILPSYRHLKVDHIVILLSRIKEKTLINADYDELPLLIHNTIEQMETLIPKIKTEIKS